MRPVSSTCLLVPFPLLLQLVLASSNGHVSTASGCAASSKTPLQRGPGRAVSTDWTDFTLTHWARGEQGNSAAPVTAWLYTATVNEVFLKGTLLGNGVISSRKIYVRRFHCHSSSLAPSSTSTQPCIVSIALDCSKSNHKLCIVAGYISLPRSSWLPPPPLPPACFLSRSPIPLSLLPFMLQRATWGGICAPLCLVTACREMGSVPSQLEELGEEGKMLWIRASTERISAGLICSSEQQDEWLFNNYPWISVFGFFIVLSSNWEGKTI